MDSLDYAKRYVVEGTNSFTRLLWSAAIVAAFTLAWIMIISNLEDVRENPIVSSIDTVPVQEIPFPAVTLSGAYVRHPFRLMQSVLNTAIFDCIGPRCQRLNDIQEYENKAKRNLTKQTAESVDLFDYQKHKEENDNDTDEDEYKDQCAPFKATIDFKCTGHTNLVNSNLDSEDCIDFGNTCLAQSEKAWTDFHPAIEYAVFKVLDSGYYWTYIEASTDYDEAREEVIVHLLCPSEDWHWYLTTPGESLITKVFDLANVHVNMDPKPTNDSDHDLVRLLASTFRRPLQHTINTITDYIHTNYPTYKYVGNLEECQEMMKNMSTKQIASMARLVDAAGLVSRHQIRDELRLGNLILYAFTYYENEDYEYNELVYGFESPKLMQTLKKLMKDYSTVLFPKIENIISPLHLIKVLSSSLPKTFCRNSDVFEDQGWPIDEDLMCDFKYPNDNLPPFKAVLKLMKYMVLPSSQHVVEKSENEDFQKFQQHFINKSYTMSNMKMKHEDYSILACKINEAEMSDFGNCNLFSKRYTTNGIGYVFNGLPYWQMYKDTESNKAFHKEFVDRQGSNADESPMMIKANGDSFSLDFYVRHSVYTYNEDTVKLTPVILSINDPSFVPDVKGEGIHLKPGRYYEICITPTITSTDESALEFDPEKRNCLTRNEGETLSVFNAYSQTACMFECQLRKAIEVCNCTAWDYPRVSESANLCAGDDGIKCFEFVMSRPMNPEFCDCPNDCENIHYDVSMHVMSLDDYYESDRDSFIRYERDHYYSQAYLRPFIIYENIEFHNQPYEETTIWGIFRDRFNYNKALSRVKIKVRTRTATKIVRSAKVSFSSQVANLGGLIGLFTGMSILSLAELAFWVVKYIRHVIVNYNCFKKINVATKDNGNNSNITPVQPVQR